MKTQKPVIAVDIDEVLVTYAKGFINYYNELHQTQYKLDDLYVYRFEDISKDTTEYIVKQLHGYADVAERWLELPIPGAVEAISRLAERFEVDIITTRPYKELEQTQRWLIEHFPGAFRSVNFVRSSEDTGSLVSKVELCQRSSAEFLIDDHPRYVTEAAQAGIKGLLFGDYPWNQVESLPKNVTRVRNWDEVLEQLLGQEVLNGSVPLGAGLPLQDDSTAQDDSVEEGK